MAHISDMALTNALKALQHAQIIDRRAYNEVPPRVEYCLTEKGAQLVPIVRNAANGPSGIMVRGMMTTAGNTDESDRKKK